MLLGFWSLFLSPHHIQRAAVILKPTTLFKFHDILKKRKYRLLYTARRKGKPGPKTATCGRSIAAVCSNSRRQLELQFAMHRLPAPNGPIYIVLRMYWPKESVLNGSWEPPGIQAAKQ